jgi:pimeloyl-ACP methyl ester carboxylesterase
MIKPSFPGQKLRQAAFRQIPMRGRWRRGLKWLAALAGLVLILAIGLNVAAPRFLPRAILWGPNTDRSIDPAEDPAPTDVQALGVSVQQRVAVGPPPASLLVWTMEPAGAAKGTIVLLHGIQDRKESMRGFARAFRDRGYRTVLVDLRAHGRSSGRWLSFGVFESADLVQVLDALKIPGGLKGGVGAFGISYGGATGIQWAGRDPRVRAVVTVATFTSMRAIVPRYVRLYLFGLGLLLPDSRIQRCVDQAGTIAGFDPDQASPVRAIARSQAAFLLFHGTDDWKIPPDQARALHRAAPNHSRLVLIQDETHDSIMADRSGQILRESCAWFDRYLAEAAPEVVSGGRSLPSPERIP